MKKTTLIAFLGVTSLLCQAQYSTNLTPNNTNGFSWTNGEFRYSFKLPKFLLPTSGVGVEGNLAYDPTTKKVYYNDGTAWTLISGGLNIYNTSSTIADEDRFVTIRPGRALYFLSEDATEITRTVHAKNMFDVTYRNKDDGNINKMGVGSGAVYMSVSDALNAHQNSFSVLPGGPVYTGGISGQNGIKYAADYSSHYTDLSLITKGDLDNGIASIVTLYTGDGIIPTDITRTVTISDPTIYGTKLSFDANSDGGLQKIKNTFGSYETNLQTKTYDLDGVTELAYAGLRLGSTALRLESTGSLSTGMSTFLIQNGGASYTDNSFSVTGITYAGDYSATFVDRSLIDKGYLDSRLSSIAAWGLTGNTGTDPDVNYIGTNDDQRIIFKTNGIKSGQIGLNGSNNNIVFGVGSLPDNTSANNVAFGNDVMTLLTSGGGNVGIGAGAMTSATTTTNTVAIGNGAYGFETDGNDNTMIGANTGLVNPADQFAIALGSGAMATSGQFALSDQVNNIKCVGCGDAGNAGYVLTGDGSGKYTAQAPVTTSLVINQIGYGTGTGITSSADFYHSSFGVNEQKDDGFLSLIGATHFGFASLVNNSSTGGSLEVGNTAGNYFDLSAANLTGVRSLQAPNANGVLGISVNGTPFGTNGDVTIATGTVLNGTGFVKASGTTISYDNSSYSLTGHTHAAADIVSGTIATARLGSGTANSGTYLAGNQTWVTFPTIPTVTPAALTKTDDTNITLTLGGTPSTALLQAVSITAGWTGTLADGRIASAANWNTAYSNRISTFTTTGSSGAATFSGNTLNIPTYTLAGLGGISLSSLSATSPLTYNNTTGVFAMPVSTNSIDGYLSSTDHTTFAAKQAALVSGTNIKTVNGSTLLGSGNLPVGDVLSTASNTYTAGMKQIFVPNSTNAGLNIGSLTANPSALVDGDMWKLNTGELRYYDNAAGTSRTVATLTLAQTLSNKTLISPVISTITNTGTLTLPTATGTLALTSDITGTNSGTNTGDQTITLTGEVTGSGTGSFAATISNSYVKDVTINTIPTALYSSSSASSSTLTHTATLSLPSLATQSPYNVFATGSSSGTPTFQSLVANHITLPANSMIVNNTAGSAVGSTTDYKRSGDLTYSQTVTAPSGTAPTGTNSSRFYYETVGNLVTLTVYVSYATASVGTTSFVIPLPTGVPAPAPLFGLGAANDILYPATGFVGSSMSSATTARCALTMDAGGTGYQITTTQTSGNYKFAWVTVQYFK